MADSIRERILSGLKTKLDNITTASVFRSRAQAIAKAKTPFIVIQPLNDRADVSMIPKLDWDLTFRITVGVRGDIPDKIADPLIQSVFSQVLSDQGLGGLTIDIQAISVNYRIDDGDSNVLEVELDFRALYRTSYVDLTTI